MAITLSTSSAILLPSLSSHITNQSAMPPRSSCSSKKSNKHLKKAHNKHFASQQPNHHSSPALLDHNILSEQNGRNGNFPVSPSSDKCQFLGVEEEKKKGFSVTAGLNEMEGSVEETQKVVESQSEDKQVVGFDEEKVKTVVESDAAEVVAETQVAEEQQQEDSNTVEQKEEEESSPLVEPEKVEDASELIVDDIKVLEAELKQKANQEEDSQEAEPPSEQTNEPSSVVETETSREAEAYKLDSSEEKKESSSIETDGALRISESSVPETDVASRAIEDTKPIVEPEESGETPILKPEESGETKLPDEEQKVEESIVVKESSKEEAKESLPPSDVATAETTGTTMQEKTEMPTSTESQQTTVNLAPREHASWSSCCGIFDFLFR